jgi:hypothetical protein
MNLLHRAMLLDDRSVVQTDTVHVRVGMEKRLGRLLDAPEADSTTTA